MSDSALGLSTIPILRRFTEVGSHSQKLSDALKCSNHLDGRCPGCRHRYKTQSETQPVPAPRSFTPLGEIELFGDSETHDDQQISRQLWRVFGEALVEYHAYVEDWLPELVMARSHDVS